MKPFNFSTFGRLPGLSLSHRLSAKPEAETRGNGCTASFGTLFRLRIRTSTSPLFLHTIQPTLSVAAAPVPGAQELNPVYCQY